METIPYGTPQGTATTKASVWHNWAGNVTARPVRNAIPASVDELRAVVRQAAEDGLAVKAVGSATPSQQQPPPTAC